MIEVTKKVASGSFWFSVGNGVTKVVGLGTVFILLHQLSVFEYGLLELVLSVVPIMSLIVLPGLDQLVLTEMGHARGAGDHARAKGVFKTYVFLQIGLNIFAFLVLFLGARFAAPYLGASAFSAGLLEILAFSFLVSPFRAAVVTLLSVHWKFASQTIFVVAEESAKLVAVILSLLVFDWGLPGVMVGIVLDSVVAIIVCAPLFMGAWKAGLSKVHASHVPIRELIGGAGLWAILSTYLNNFSANLRLWLIKLILGTEAVGLYAVASGLYSNTLSLLPLSRIMTQVIPQYTSTPEKFNLIVAKAIKYQLVAHISLAIFAFFVFPPIIVFLFPAYTAAMPLFEILLLAVIPASFGTIIVPVFYSLRRQRNLFSAILLKNVLTLVILPITATFLGVIGIAVEQVLTASIYTAERTRVMRRLLPNLPLTFRGLFKIDEADRIVFVAIVRHFFPAWRQ